MFTAQNTQPGMAARPTRNNPQTGDYEAWDGTRWVPAQRPEAPSHGGFLGGDDLATSPESPPENHAESPAT